MIESLVRTNTQSSDTGTVVTVKRQSPSKKLGDKISSWFKNSIDLEKKSLPKSMRRNSEGSKGFASRLQKSFRSKRVSTGSSEGPRASIGSLESTPIGSMTVTGKTSAKFIETSFFLFLL